MLVEETFGTNLQRVKKYDLKPLRGHHKFFEAL